MKSLPIVAVISAAVVGAAAGTALALQSFGSDEGVRSTLPSAQSSRGNKTDVVPSSPGAGGKAGTLLYADREKIYDGKREVPIDGPRNVVGLARAQGGYIVVESNNPEQTKQSLWYINTKGTARDIASIGRSWDVSRDGLRAVAVDSQSGRLTVWSIPRGIPDRAWPDSAVKDIDNLTFTGPEQVTFTDTSPKPDSSEKPITWVQWSLKGNMPQRGTKELPTRAVPSVDGQWTVGLVGPNGARLGTVDGACARADRIKGPGTWTNCDSIPVGDTLAYSPDGTRLLAMPSETDGQGPSEYHVLDATTGKRMQVIDMPQATTASAWKNNNTLEFVGNDKMRGDINATWIRECSVNGKCKTVVRSDQPIVIAKRM